MSVLAILYIVILISIYLTSYQNSIDQTDNNLRLLCRRNGFKILNQQTSKRDTINADNYYLVYLSYDGKVLKIKNDDNSGFSNQKLGNLALKLSKKVKGKGNIDDLSYLKRERRNGIYVAFANNSLQISYYKNLLYTIIIIGCIGLALLFLTSIWLSHWLIKPVETAFHKQKQFISNASHELKTPIAVISSNTDALQREMGESKWLDYIRVETNSLNKLVTGLLQLATIDSIEERASFTKLNLSELVMSITLPFESIAYEKQIHLDERIDDNIFFTGDSTKLGQLTAILIDNALNYTEKGGNITVKLSRHHDRRVLTVSNTGIGIPPSEQAHIFERFYRIDEARNREQGNYGLGLAIAKSITQLHHGKISVISKNHLTTFKVVL